MRRFKRVSLLSLKDDLNFISLNISVYILREVNLQAHIMRVHNELNFNENQTSCFFNLSTTLNSSPGRTLDKSSLTVSDTNDFYVNQCLNCHEFFPSVCSYDLSHNCWAYNTINSKNAEKKQSSTNNNYFSPIFLKFNLSYVLNSRFYNNCDSKLGSIELNQIQQNGNQQSNNLKMIKLDHS